MATIINNPAPATNEVREVRTDGGGGTGFIVGLIVLLLLAVLFFSYGLPALRSAGNGRSATLNVNVNKTPTTQSTPAQ